MACWTAAELNKHTAVLPTIALLEYATPNHIVFTLEFLKFALNQSGIEAEGVFEA